MGAVIDLDAVVSAKAEQAFRDRWPRLTAIDLASELPPVAWVCEALALAPGAVTIVGGAGFGGKTVSMQSFLLAVASGTKAWGHYDVTTGRVVHIDFEQGRHLTQLRYQRLARAMRIDLRDLEGQIEAHCLPRARLDDDRSYDELVRLLDGARVAIVDAFRGAFPSAKENDSGVREHLDLLQRVSERTGCMIVVIAHSRKMSDDVDIRSSLRGSGALFDASQTVYMLDGHPKKCTRVTNTKDRWLGETRETFGLRIKDEMDPTLGSTDRRWGLVVEYAAPCEVQAEYMFEDDTDQKIAMNVERIVSCGTRVIALLNGAPDGLSMWNLRGILQQTMTPSDLSAALDELVRQGTIDQDGKGASAVYRRRDVGS